MGNLGPGGSINTDRLAWVLLVHHNNPDPETCVSPSQVIFGLNLRDHPLGLYGKYQPRDEWCIEADQRTHALAKHHGSIDDQLRQGTCALPPLSLEDTVLL